MREEALVDARASSFILPSSPPSLKNMCRQPHDTLKTIRTSGQANQHLVYTYAYTGTGPFFPSAVTTNSHTHAIQKRLACGLAMVHPHAGVANLLKMMLTLTLPYLHPHTHTHTIIGISSSSLVCFSLWGCHTFSHQPAPPLLPSSVVPKSLHQQKRVCVCFKFTAADLKGQ